jgi:hypothetical protein
MRTPGVWVAAAVGCTLFSRVAASASLPAAPNPANILVVRYPGSGTVSLDEYATSGLQTSSVQTVSVPSCTLSAALSQGEAGPA